MTDRRQRGINTCLKGGVLEGKSRGQPKDLNKERERAMTVRAENDKKAGCLRPHQTFLKAWT